MKTIEIKIYSFNELSEHSKQVAIDKAREKNDISYIYDEAYNTVKEFNNIFNISEGVRSWLDYSINHIDDNILELKGVRLYKYLINNFYNSLYRKKYLKSFDEHKKHKMIINKIAKHTNKKYSFAYSNINFTNDCTLTGVCYDYYMLKPIYEFIEKNYLLDSFKYITFEMLINDCFDNLRLSLENEEEYLNSDEAIIENIKANEYMFLENGQMYF